MTGQISAAIIQAYRSLDDIEKWAGVLEKLVCELGACKALISLRDRNTAELVIPNDVSRRFTSPLIYGFSDTEVETYLNQYQRCDPWTKIENKWHPYQPYPLSQYLPHSALRQTTFWKWLEPQGINDSIVFSLHSSNYRWVALNIYTKQIDRHKLLEACDYLRAVAPDLQHAWRLCEAYHKFEAGLLVKLDYLTDAKTPAALLNEYFEIISVNKLGEKSLCKHLNTNKQLKVSETVILPKNIKNDIQAQLIENITVPRALAHWESAIFGHRLSISLMAKQDDTIGRQSAAFLLTALPQRNRPLGLDKPIWETEGLNETEREIVKWRAEGKTIKSFAIKKGISESAAYGRLKEAKKHLLGLSSRDIYTIHQQFLQKNL